MPRRFLEEGIILKRRAFTKQSKLLYLFSRGKGLIKVIARGALLSKSKFAGILEPFSLLSLELVAWKEFYYLSSATFIESFFPPGTSLEELEPAYKIAELAIKILPEGEQNEKVYSLTLESLKALSRFYSEKILLWYKLHLLSGSGFAPKMPKDFEKERYFFSVEEGGFIEERVKEAIPFTKGETLLFKKILESPLPEVLELEVAEEAFKKIEAAASEFFCYHI